MSKQRRTADDFVRDMKAKQQHNTPGDIGRKTSEGLAPEQAGAWRGNRGLTAWPIPHCGRQEQPQSPRPRFVTKGSPFPAALDR
jgi:hypothetical protein